MKHNDFPLVVIIVTVILALLVFSLSDHSGFSVNDCSIEKNNQEKGVYDLSYRLLVGRFFNKIECKYVLYSEENRVISNGTTQIENISMGSHPINEHIVLANDSQIPQKVNITIYTQINIQEEGINKTYMEESYSKLVTFD